MQLTFRALLLAALVGFTHFSWAEGNQLEKFALILANSRYTGEGALPNTTRDGQLMSETLKALAFKVSEHYDLNREQMMSRVSEFSASIPKGATALVYFAGHGMQVGGGNYLLPVDIRLTGEQSAPLKAYPVRHLEEQLALSQSAVNIIILDACRNNPFQPTSAVKYRSFATMGLAKVTAPRGTLIAYSTAPGQRAADGRGKNSIYTEALAGQLREAGVELRQVFDKVANTVRRKSLDEQIPWYNNSLVEDYYFLPPKGVSVAAGTPLNNQKQVVSGPSRSATPSLPPGFPVNWFTDLSQQEWDMLDWEIQQRVKRLTADELPLLEHKAKGGSLVHQTTLGLVYKAGIDKAVDPASGKVMRYGANNTKALKWLRKAADAGFPIAQAELGEMYYQGHGLDRDLSLSRHWLEKATESPYMRAKLDLLQLNTMENAERQARDPLLNKVRKITE